MIAALGVVLGLYLFFRGFRHLQRAPITNTIVPATSDSPPKTVVTITSRISDEIIKNAQSEVIRLSPEQSAASLMSQQSRIAAALHKAGIANSVSWNDSTNQAAGDARRSVSDAKNLPALQSQKLQVTRTAPFEPQGSPNSEKQKPGKSSVQKPNWMLWLGGALVLAGAYALAFHFRLL